MRPTNLQFRSPKEATPGPYNPLVNKRGKKLYAEKTPTKCTFGVSNRFREYEILAKRSGSFVGPGTYRTGSSNITHRRVVGGCAYKSNHEGFDVPDNGFFYVGNHLVFEPKLSANSKHRGISSRTNSPSRSGRPISARRTSKNCD